MIKTILSEEERDEIAKHVYDAVDNSYGFDLSDAKHGIRLTEQAILKKIEKEIDEMKIYRRESNNSKIDWNKTKEQLKQSLFGGKG